MGFVKNAVQMFHHPVVEPSASLPHVLFFCTWDNWLDRSPRLWHMWRDPWVEMVVCCGWMWKIWFFGCRGKHYMVYCMVAYRLASVWSAHSVAILLYTGHSLSLEVVCMQPWVAKGKFCSFFGLCELVFSSSLGCYKNIVMANHILGWYDELPSSKTFASASERFSRWGWWKWRHFCFIWISPDRWLL